MDPLREPDKVAFAGDWHGNLNWASYASSYAKEMGADVIVHAGDFGYKFEDRYLDGLNVLLHRFDLPLLFVDGNHDHQGTLHKYPHAEGGGFGGLRQLRSHIFFVPRGFRWIWHHKEWLALGGAYSVDRKIRDQYGPGHWWPEEQLTKNDTARAMQGGHADIMISHDCPSGVQIPGVTDERGVLMFGYGAIKGANAHRDRVREVVDKVQPTLIVHGHYHRHYRLTADLGYGPVDVIGLDCDGTSLEENVTFWTH